MSGKKREENRFKITIMASMNTLLNWGIENASTGENFQQTDRPLRPIDKEILDLITQSDASKMSVLAKIIASGDASLEMKESALEQLQFYVESIDNANDLHHETVNGLMPVIESLKSQYPGIRMRAAWVLATCVANNPKFQKTFVDCGGLEATVDALKHEDQMGALSKIVYVVSGLLDHNTDILVKFRKLGGFEQLVRVISLGEEEVDQFQQLHAQQFAEELDNMKEVQLAPEDLDLPVDPEIPVLETVEESVRKKAYALQQIKKQGVVEDAREQWSRSVHKIVFLFLKLARENEELKLAYIKDGNGLVFNAILSLLQRDTFSADLVLKERLLQLVLLLLTSRNPTMENYILDIVNKSFPTLEHWISNEKSKVIARNNPEEEDIKGLLVQTFVKLKPSS